MALTRYAVNAVECACCQEADIEFLTLDHVNNDGAEHRKSMKSHTLWNWLKQAGYPPGFQILCFNCNIARSIYGTCPHEARRAVLRAAGSVTPPEPSSPRPAPASG